MAAELIEAFWGSGVRRKGRKATPTPLPFQEGSVAIPSCAHLQLWYFTCDLAAGGEEFHPAQVGTSSCSFLCLMFSVLALPGGVVLNPAYYGMQGHTNTMIHEVGHVLGLYHVFKGVSERESCDDPCRETAPSMETGDLCADTAPTPKSKLCRDPDPTNDTCGQTHFMGTPFNNYMSYTGKGAFAWGLLRGPLL